MGLGVRDLLEHVETLTHEALGDDREHARSAWYIYIYRCATCSRSEGSHWSALSQILILVLILILG